MIQVLRSIIAVIVGYVMFAASAFAIFQFSGQAAHAEASTSFMAVSIVSGMLFALIGGYVAGWIAGRSAFAHGVAMATLLALGATVSLVSTVGHGAVWSQVAALALMAPSAALGGWVRSKSVFNGTQAGEIQR